jgi:hypothetical protein
MTIDFKVGDEIWWLDTSDQYNPKIRDGIVDGIEHEKSYSRYKLSIRHSDYVLIYHESCFMQPYAKTKEDLISLLTHPKVGPYAYNQQVFIIEKQSNKDYNNLNIVKGYIKKEVKVSNDYGGYFKYIVSIDKECSAESLRGFTNVYDEKDIYTSTERAQKFIAKWLNDNDN